MSSISVYHLLKKQIPTHIQQNYPLFCKFVEYYYRWLQTIGFVDYQSIQGIDDKCQGIEIVDTPHNPSFFVGHTISNGEALAEIVGLADDNKTLIIRNLRVDREFKLGDKIHVRKNSDDEYTNDEIDLIDTGTISNTVTISNMFIDHFCKLLDADNLFGNQSNNISTILRHIGEIYKTKGNEEGLTYIIKTLRGIDAEIKYPWDNVLILDGAKWNQPYMITVRSDEEYWQNVPINFSRIRIQSLGYNENYERTFIEKDVTKIEVFGKVSENYDEDIYNIKFPKDSCKNYGEWLYNTPQPSSPDFQYWNRDENKELGPWQEDPITGGLIFNDEKGTATYGRFGNRIVNPFMRLYFNHDFNVDVNQEINVMGIDENDREVILYRGYVTKGISGLKIINPGLKWQIGQVFTTSKNTEWRLYKTFGRDDSDKRITIINDYDIPVEYSMDKPLIGRVLATDEEGRVTSVEILQYGDHIPEQGSKIIRVSPQFEGEIDHPEWDMEVEIEYDVCCKGAGEWEDTRNMLDDNEVRIQDSHYYQQFSYDIFANAPFKDYHDLANLFHPVGTNMFSTYRIENDINAQSSFKIEDGEKIINLTLFDTFFATEEIIKSITKIVRDSLESTEHLKKSLTKPIKDTFGIVDESMQDSGVMYGFDANYDKHEEEEQYFEKTLEGVIKTSYGDSGFTNLLHINYDHHVIADIPIYPKPNIDETYHLVCVGDSDCEFEYESIFEAEKNVTITLTLNEDHITNTEYSIINAENYELIENIDIKEVVDPNDDTIRTISFTGPSTNIIFIVVNSPGSLQITTEKEGYGYFSADRGFAKKNDVVSFIAEGKDYDRPFKPTEVDRIEISEIVDRTEHNVATLTSSPYQYTMRDYPIKARCYFKQREGGFLTLLTKGLTKVDVVEALNENPVYENHFIKSGTTLKANADVPIDACYYYDNDNVLVNCDVNSIVFPNSDITLVLVANQSYLTIDTFNSSSTYIANGKVDAYNDNMRTIGSTLVAKGNQTNKTRIDWLTSGWLENGQTNIIPYKKEIIDNSRIEDEFVINDSGTLKTNFIANGGFVLNHSPYRFVSYNVIGVDGTSTFYEFGDLDWVNNVYREKRDDSLVPTIAPNIPYNNPTSSVNVNSYCATNVNFPPYYNNTKLRSIDVDSKFNANVDEYNPTTNTSVLDGWKSTIDSGSWSLNSISINSKQVRVNVLNLDNFELTSDNDSFYTNIKQIVTEITRIPRDPSEFEFTDNINNKTYKTIGYSIRFDDAVVDDEIDAVIGGLETSTSFTSCANGVVRLIPTNREPLYDFNMRFDNQNLVDRYGNVSFSIPNNDDDLIVGLSTANVGVKVVLDVNNPGCDYEIGETSELNDYVVAYKLIVGNINHPNTLLTFNGTGFTNRFNIPIRNKSIDPNINNVTIIASYRLRDNKTSTPFKRIAVDTMIMNDNNLGELKQNEKKMIILSIR